MMNNSSSFEVSSSPPSNTLTSTTITTTTTSIFNTLEELCDDDNFYTVHDNVFQMYPNTNTNHTTNTLPSTGTSTRSTNYGFNLNLSSLNGNHQNNNHNTHSSPRREIDLQQDGQNSQFGIISPRRSGSEDYPLTALTDPLISSYFARNDSQRPRRESEGYYSSPREHTPRELTPRRDSEIYLQSQSRGHGEPFYSSSQDMLRPPTDPNFSGVPPLQSRRENEYLTHYSPRDGPTGIANNKPSPRDGHFSERAMSRESDSYYGSCEPTPRDHNYRRDSSAESVFYSPRDSLSSPRTNPNDGYYPGSSRGGGGGGDLTPREKIIRSSAGNYYGSSKSESSPDKSVPNPYAAPFVPQRSASSGPYGAVPLSSSTMSYVPPYMNQNMRQHSQPIPYEYLQRPPHFLMPTATVGGGGGGGGSVGPFRLQFDGVPHQLQHSIPYQTEPNQSSTSTSSSTAQRPNIPPLSFSVLNSSDYTSTDSEESAASNSGGSYYSPKYPPNTNTPTGGGGSIPSRAYTNQQIHPRGGGMSSPASNRPHPMFKSNLEKMFEHRRMASSSSSSSSQPYTNGTSGRVGYPRAASYTNSTAGNLSGRRNYNDDDEKAMYYPITPQQQQQQQYPYHGSSSSSASGSMMGGLMNIPPLPIYPLKILSIDVNGSFNATDESFSLARNAFFDYIEESQAQVVLMSNTGLENEDQLKVVRNEVKAKYNTESAMWASFKSPGADGGRGVGVLVLGPLAPRTGWIVSDSCGHILSASSRVKPGLPVLCFIACDCVIPPLDPTPFESLQAEFLIANSSGASGAAAGAASASAAPNQKERKKKVYEKLKEIISSEHEKSVFVFGAGQIFQGGSAGGGGGGGSAGGGGGGRGSLSSSSSTDEEDDLNLNDVGVIRLPVTMSKNGKEPEEEKGDSPRLQKSDADDVIVTHQPFGDGPRLPDGTGMKVLSVEALERKVPSPHAPTLMQVAIYGWPAETFVFSQKSDGTPLSSGRRSRRNKSGRKKDEQQQQQLSPSPQLQLTISPRAPLPLVPPPPPLEISSSVGPYSYSSHHTTMPFHYHHPLPTPPLPYHSSNSSPDLLAWKQKVHEFQIRLHEILNSTSWGVVRLDQMKDLLHELFLWIDRFNQIDTPGFPSSQSLSSLREIYVSHADQFLKTAPDMISQILQSWSIVADEASSSLPSSSSQVMKEY